MPEFKGDNGKLGAARIVRTPTGYKGCIHTPLHHNENSFRLDEVTLALHRGVGDDGEPYIEIDIANLDEEEKGVLRKIISRELEKRGFKAEEVDQRGFSHLDFFVHHNSLRDTFDVLDSIRLDDNSPLIPKSFHDFVEEQHKVRNELEQSLMFSFGNDCFLTKKGAKVPKSEKDRIQRLAKYFREGAPEIKEQYLKAVQNNGEKHSKN